MENIKLGGKIKLAGEYQGGWTIKCWVENIKLGGDNQAGWS